VVEQVDVLQMAVVVFIMEIYLTMEEYRE